MRMLAMLMVLVCAIPLLAQPNFKPADTFPPDAATRKVIQEKAEELRALTKQADFTKRSRNDQADVLIYLKAADWILKFEEWTTKDAGQQTVRVLDAGITRAKQMLKGEMPWRKIAGKPVARGYFSGIDGSVQPFSVTYPEGFFQFDKQWRVDVVLHGRDASLTEVKFINSREASKGGFKGDFVQIEPYGRGNNAYRWAGEDDVFGGLKAFAGIDVDIMKAVDQWKVILRGFSMGGAGAWHIGLHNQHRFAVISPGAGFTTTRGYIKNLPEKLPDYQEKCLRIYDAYLYAENAFNVPVVAYSGEKDPQKAAADNIENALKSFKEPLKFTHVVAPGLEHKLPPEWQAKLDEEYRKHLPRAELKERSRFVTYTTKYGVFEHGRIAALEKQYEKGVVDSRWNDKTKHLDVTTSNVRALVLEDYVFFNVQTATIDGTSLSFKGREPNSYYAILDKTPKGWVVTNSRSKIPLRKGYVADEHRSLQGPIDDAFTDAFYVVAPNAPAADIPNLTHGYTEANLKRFSYEWERYFRGKLPSTKSERANVILFGDPKTNPEIAKVLPKLPIKWTETELVVNGVTYDARTHVPVLIYPHPHISGRYVVLNSGHTFHEADLKGTNALLYPRLGDWAVLKPTPTSKDPALAEVVAAGLFDENWQFEKK